MVGRWAAWHGGLVAGWMLVDYVVVGRPPKHTILRFAPGKMVCVGAYSEGTASSGVDRPYSVPAESDVWRL